MSMPNYYAGITPTKRGEIGYVVFLHLEGGLQAISNPSEDDIRAVFSQYNFIDVDNILEIIKKKHPDTYGYVFDILKMKDAVLSLDN